MFSRAQKGRTRLKRVPPDRGVASCASGITPQVAHGNLFPTEGRATRPRPVLEAAKKPEHYCSGSAVGFFRQFLYFPLFTRLSGGGWVSLSIAHWLPTRMASIRPSAIRRRALRASFP
nr:MAG TPA_asm: hypothetical protein [Caudoviricetes sp.]